MAQSTWNGGAGPVGKPKAPVKKAPSPKLIRGVLAGLVVVLLAGGACWFLTRPAPLPEKKPVPTVKQPKAPKPTPARVQKPAPAPTTNAVEKPVPVQPPPASLAWRNKNLTDKQREDAYAKHLAETPLPNTSSNRLFRSGLEQAMGWVFTTDVGDMPPPLPRVPDFDLVHLQEILDSKSTVNEGDTEKHIDAKTTVDFAKEELKKYLEKGGTPDDFLQYYHDKLKSAFQERQMVQQQAIKVLQEDPALVDEFLKNANEGLAKKGIKAAVLPERLRRRVESMQRNNKQ